MYALLAYQPFPAKFQLGFWIECLREICVSAQSVCQCILMARDVRDICVHLMLSHEKKIYWPKMCDIPGVIDSPLAAEASAALLSVP